MPVTSRMLGGGEAAASTVMIVAASTAPAGKTSSTCPPAAVTVPPSGRTRISLVTTATSAEPSTPSVVAVILASPTASGVTSPEALTVATDSSEDDQVKVLPDIVFPLASRAVALSWTCSPREVRVLEAGVTCTDATGPVMPGPPSSPSQEKSATSSGRRSAVPATAR